MKTLVCTVGGSYQPIVTAVLATKPDFVLFVCSEDDLDTGRSGSYEQITKKGVFLKSNFKDEKPTKANIPSQLEMIDDSFEVLCVHSDDLDDAYSKISQRVSDFVERGDEVLVDYTGGTKSMSAALCLAALDFESVSLQLVTGMRADLNKVSDGTQQAVQASIGRTRFRLKLRQALASWEVYAYDDTILQLAQQSPTYRDDRADLSAVRNLSRAFAAWDRFEHQEAFSIIESYVKRFGVQLIPYLTQLRLITTDSPKKVPVLLFDLWLNAQRRAEQRRFDDATSRAYRLLEWSAQWLLQSQAGIDASNIQDEQIPEGMVIYANSKGIKQTALLDSWQLASIKCSEDVQEYWQENEMRMKDLLSIRNNSILAHGFDPITEAQWSRMLNFIEDGLIPLLTQQAQKQKIKLNKVQLPTELIGLLK
ncbi:TIGR02710 family CRISPR-associated CARF protein [Leucothrix arctica]|uniref:TIGR02710 family CRISPR-associated protein n=1 Tax=Leucothrix arctica TaxID=1481894 RepID=A0A317CL56_9GAMM|nr:TIGR02710 family CRISPR-associated CARF protein [Leucothrix arctica]PWQ99324.1 TIGR02710 family CRISPR-associated protein [Leucothrix arctica]